jgi:hypothetical protein
LEPPGAAIFQAARKNAKPGEVIGRFTILTAAPPDYEQAGHPGDGGEGFKLQRGYAKPFTNRRAQRVLL